MKLKYKSNKFIHMILLFMLAFTIVVTFTMRHRINSITPVGSKNYVCLAESIDQVRNIVPITDEDAAEISKLQSDYPVSITVERMQETLYDDLAITVFGSKALNRVLKVTAQPINLPEQIILQGEVSTVSIDGETYYRVGDYCINKEYMYGAGGVVQGNTVDVTLQVSEDTPIISGYSYINRPE